jgi:hypothetical protein
MPFLYDGTEQIQVKIIFGSYAYTRNFYAENRIEFINIFVKDGTPINNLSQEIKESRFGIYQY